MPGLQAPFAAPISLTRTYEGTEPKAWTALNWALVEHGDQKTSLGLSILAHILTATPASPLRKALIDSGLGEDLAGFGLEDSLRRGAWSVGLKGVRPEEVAKVESLILDELSRLAEKGIDPDTVEASLNTVEFALREKNTGRFPRGLAVMLEALNEWLYDENPIEALSFGASLEAIKKDVAAGKRYFEALIRTWFLDNPHRSAVTILPDPEEDKRREAPKRLNWMPCARECPKRNSKISKRRRDACTTCRKLPTVLKRSIRYLPFRFPICPRNLPGSPRKRVKSLPQLCFSTIFRRVRSSTLIWLFRWTVSGMISCPISGFSVAQSWKREPKPSIT